MPTSATAFLKEPSAATRSSRSARPSPNFTRPANTTQTRSFGSSRPGAGGSARGAGARGARARAARATSGGEHAAGRGRGEPRAVHDDVAVDDHVRQAHRVLV